MCLYTNESRPAFYPHIQVSVTHTWDILAVCLYTKQSRLAFYTCIQVSVTHTWDILAVCLYTNEPRFAFYLRIQVSITYMGLPGCVSIRTVATAFDKLVVRVTEGIIDSPVICTNENTEIHSSRSKRYTSVMY